MPRSFLFESGWYVRFFYWRRWNVQNAVFMCVLSSTRVIHFALGGKKGGWVLEGFRRADIVANRYIGRLGMKEMV